MSDAKARQAAVVLAAGASSRMGSVKALLDVGGGRTLLRAVCDRLAEVGCAPIIVVLGHHRESLVRALEGLRDGADRPVQTVVNADPDRGQVSSMAIGLAEAAKAAAGEAKATTGEAVGGGSSEPASSACALVALVDQPPVSVATIRALLGAAAAEPSAVHVPTFQHVRGHPAIFPTALAAHLEAARPGEGARDVLSRLGTTVREHPMDEAGVTVDLDTPADVARWRGESAPSVPPGANPLAGPASQPKPSPAQRAPIPPAGAQVALTDATLFAEAARRSAAREPFVLCSVISTARSAPREAGAKMIVGEDGTIAGTVGGGPLEASAIFEAGRLLREGGASTVLDFALSAAGDRAEVLPERKGRAAADEELLALGMKCGGEVSLFLDLVRPTPRLLVYGAGHVGERVAAIASEAGLHTSVVDDREGYVTRDRFPRAAELRCVDLAQDPRGGLVAGPEDFVVIVTRCHDLDEGVLQAALQTRARYIGLIGSRRKVAVILRSIERRTGRDPRRDPRLHAPIGLRLGDKSPGEIAISILAEVLLVKSAGALAHSRLPPREADPEEVSSGQDPAAAAAISGGSSGRR